MFAGVAAGSVAGRMLRIVKTFLPLGATSGNLVEPIGQRGYMDCFEKRLTPNS